MSENVNVQKNVQGNIESQTKTSASRRVRTFLMSGKLKEDIIEDDLEALKENKVDIQKEKEYNELKCHVCNIMFTNGESIRNNMRKSYYFCTNCSNLFLDEN